jgi:D-alanine-D-alanine ligase
MTKIGFAFNLKPDADGTALSSEPDPAEDEPPSSARAAASRSRAQVLAASDEFAEWDSEETVAAVESALGELGDVIRLDATDEFPERLRDCRPDIVFNMAEGLRGASREAQVPAICEFFGVPYSGSDPLTLSLCLDKRRTKEILAYHGIPTAPFAVVESEAQVHDLASAMENRQHAGPWLLQLPLFVKPLYEGSSKGITERNLCATPGELTERTSELLQTYSQPVLVEEFLSGSEFTCAVLGNGSNARVLPIVALDFSALPKGALPIYGFEAKWIWDAPEHQLEIYECPASINPELERRIVKVTLDAYRVLGCRDWSRVDVRLDSSGVPNVVEVNPLPGVLPDVADNSCMPKAARAAGMSYNALIQACLQAAADRQGIALSHGSARKDAWAAVR